MTINYKLTSKIDLEDGKWKEIYIGIDSNGIKYKKTVTKEFDRKIIKKEGNREYYAEKSFREWTPNGYVYKTIISGDDYRRKLIDERKKWKPFGEILPDGNRLSEEIYIDWVNPPKNIATQKLIQDIKEELSYSNSEEYIPPTLTLSNKNNNTNSDEYQLPENIISSIDNKITVVVTNIITNMNDDDLYSYIREMAEENGIPTKINIPPVKFIYDRQSRMEKPLPRLAFIEYPHEADAHYSIEYLDKKVIDHNIIEASIQIKKNNI
jgi:hypothetical protein